MITTYIDCMKRWLDFSSRAPRREFNYFTLARILLIFLITGTMAALMKPAEGADPQMANQLGTGGIIASGALLVYYIWEITAGVASTVRRIRDLNWPSWAVIGLFIPAVNTVMIICLMVLKSKPAPAGQKNSRKAA